MSDKDLRHLVSVSAFQRGQILPVHRLIHRILVTAFRLGQLAGVAIAEFGGFSCAVRRSHWRCEIG